MLAVQYDEETRPEEPEYYLDLLTTITDIRMVRQNLERAVCVYSKNHVLKYVNI